MTLLEAVEIEQARTLWELGKVPTWVLQAELAARATEPDYQDLYARKDELDITEGVIYDTADGKFVVVEIKEEEYGK